MSCFFVSGLGSQSPFNLKAPTMVPDIRLCQDHGHEPCPALLSGPMLNTMTKPTLRRKDISVYSLQFILEGSLGRNFQMKNLEQNLQRKVAHRLGLSVKFSSFPALPRPTCLGESTAHSGLGPSPSILNQENTPQIWGTRQSDGDSSSTEGPSSQVCQINNRTQPSPTPLSVISSEWLRHPDFLESPSSCVSVVAWRAGQGLY